MNAFGIPVAIYEVECEIANGRPFSIAERTVLQEIAIGQWDVDQIACNMGIHPRIAEESVAALFEAGLLEFDQRVGGLVPTPLGWTAVKDSTFLPDSLAVVRRPFWILVDRLTGALELRSQVTYSRVQDLKERGVTCLPPENIDARPGRAAIRSLLERRGVVRAHEWVRSVGRPTCVSYFGSAVRVDVDGGRLVGIRSVEWCRGLETYLEGRGIPIGRTALPEEGPAESRALDIPVDRVRVLKNGAQHGEVLLEWLRSATSYIFIHSAFLSIERAQAILPDLIKALDRGVDVIVLRGFTDSPAASDTAAAFLQDASRQSRARPGRLFFQLESTQSHAKLVIRDGVAVIVGSFNWLSGKAREDNSELSVVIEHRRLAGELADIAADLVRDDHSAWPARVLRLQRFDEDEGVPAEPYVRISIVLDALHRERLFASLDQAVERMAIGSDRVTSAEDPFLSQKLRSCAERLADKKQLRIHYQRSDAVQLPVLLGVEKMGARILRTDGAHAKFLVRDARLVLVTSFNLLSFGGRSSTRASAYEVGLEIAADSETATAWLASHFSEY